MDHPVDGATVAIGSLKIWSHFENTRRSCARSARATVSKTHVMAAIGHELVRAGQAVFFTR